MAVVHENGPLYMAATLGDPVSDGRADHRVAGARVYCSTETYTIAVGDEATSTYTVGRIPKDAVLVAPSMLHSIAATTGTLDLGDASEVDSLLDGVAGAANTSYPFWPGHNTGEAGFALIGKPMWEVMGYTSSADAPQHIDLVLTLVGSTQATDPGTGVVHVYYTFT